MQALEEELHVAQVREEIASASSAPRPRAIRRPGARGDRPGFAAGAPCAAAGRPAGLALPKKTPSPTLTADTSEPLPPADSGAPTPAPAPGAAPAEPDEHVARLLEWLRLETAAPEAPRRHRGRQPDPRQLLQQRIRQEAVACYHALAERG